VVTVDGSQSSDPDGNPMTFTWDFGDGTSGDSAKMSHKYANNGDYTVSLVVTDSKGGKDSARTTARILLDSSPILIGAGNVGTCGTHNPEKTAAIVDATSGTVFTLGDNTFGGATYQDGSDSAYVHCYAPTWGRFLSRTRPTLGNHDYADGASDASGSFNYFGNRLGTGRLGYYSYDVGAWHVIVLNDKGDTDPQIHGIDAVQMQWLSADLDAHPSACTIAMWHVGLFISSNIKGWTVNPDHKAIWDSLYAKGVDVVLNGQQHNYERFAPMTPSGEVDPANGIREFNVGTGGASVDTFTVAIHPHSEVRAGVYGVLKLTLKTNSYDWEFIPIAGSTFTDSGSGSCH
jgi:PKD repeat protein